MAEKLTDLGFLETVAKGNKEFILKIVSSFIKQADEDLVKLEQYIKDQNWHEIHFISHKMKSSIHFVGMDSVKDLVARIEKYAKDKTNLDEIPQLVEEFIAKCRVAVSELKEEVTKITANNISR